MLCEIHRTPRLITTGHVILFSLSLLEGSSAETCYQRRAAPLHVEQVQRANYVGRRFKKISL